MDQILKSRIWLWLRSERAMGLPSVGPARWVEAAPVEPVRAAPVARPATAVAFRSPVQQPVVAAVPPAAPVAPAPVATPTLPASEPFTSPLLSVEERRLALAAIDEQEVRGCTRCGLCTSRTQTVFGEGAADARLMFIGEGPGFNEDKTGRPFVGPAGELLNRMIGAMGLSREQVYIANIVKCRAFLAGPPARDRAPAPEEVAACSSYIERQVEIIRPQVIVTLGVPASQFVLQTRQSMSRLRGAWQSWHGIKVMPTWHPAYLLRRDKDGDVEPKRQTWNDLQMVMAELGLAMAKKG